MKCSYFYSNNYASECWIPQLIGTKDVLSPWDIMFQVPKEYLVIASGYQVKRLVDENFAVH